MRKERKIHVNIQFYDKIKLILSLILTNVTRRHISCITFALTDVVKSYNTECISLINHIINNSKNKS